MRNNMKIIMLVFCAVLVLGACGNGNKNAGNQNQNEGNATTSNTNANGSATQRNGYSFNEFDLDIDVDGKNAIDVEYEVNRPDESKYVNTLTNLNLRGQEASDKLDEFFTKMMLTKDMTDKDVMDRIMEWFALDAYTEFDLEVDFDDGTILNIEDRK
ncbi:YusW family protein [Sporosarcina sp. UB5]|uniref:YusW family protein n=1 Tax=Sporosarcina sp. UB5 TaxID=3047463 RepID=UPI003D78EF52